MSWFESARFYQIYPLGLTGAPHEQDFCETDRLGAFVAQGWLEHIADMHFDALLLNPVWISSSHGYDTIDFAQVDPRLGTNNSLKQLVIRAHELGIKVVLDAVFNHVGRDFWAFKDVLEHRQESAYAGWFEISWHDNNCYNDGLSYTCWEGVSSLVKLNLYNPEVASYLHQMLDTWVEEFDIDGLRLDVAYCLPQDFIRGLRGHAREISVVRGREFVLIGEALFGDYRQWMADDLCHSVTNYECYKGLWSSFNSFNMHEIAYALERQSGSHPWDLYTGAHLFNFVENHDVARIATQLERREQLPVLYGLLFGMCGVPCVYYGGEWAQAGAKSYGDHELRTAHTAPVAHELSPWIGRLAAVRRDSEALVWGSYTQLSVSPDTLIFERTSAHQRVIVALNISSEERICHFDARSGQARDLLSGEMHDFGGGSRLEPLRVYYWECE